MNWISIGSAKGYSAPSHYLNQCSLMVNWTPRNKLQWNLNHNTKLSIQENAFKNVVYEISAILSRGRWVNKDNCKTRWERFKFGDLVRLILQVLKYTDMRYNGEWSNNDGLMQKMLLQCIGNGAMSLVLSHQCDLRCNEKLPDTFMKRHVPNWFKDYCIPYFTLPQWDNR